VTSSCWSVSNTANNIPFKAVVSAVGHSESPGGKIILGGSSTSPAVVADALHFGCAPGHFRRALMAHAWSAE